MQQYSSHSNINPGHDCALSEQAVALTELATYIEESAQNNSMTSVSNYVSDLAKLYIIQGRSYIQAIEAHASLNKLKSKSSTQIMVLM